MQEIKNGIDRTHLKKELSLRRIVLGTSAQADEKQKNNSNNNQTHYKYG